MIHKEQNLFTSHGSFTGLSQWCRPYHEPIQYLFQIQV